MKIFGKAFSLILTASMIAGMLNITSFAADPVCGQSEHTHVETECYSMVLDSAKCTLEEHAHTDACKTRQLICDKSLHTHTEECMENQVSGNGALLMLSNLSDPITGTISENMTWNDGDVIGAVTIESGVTITVNGTVTVTGTIVPCGTVVFNGADGAKLIRGSEFTGHMFSAEGADLTFNNLILDGGAVWEGAADRILNRGTTNSGVKSTGNMLYLNNTRAALNNSVLQNHDGDANEAAQAVFLCYYATIEIKDSVIKNNSCYSAYVRGGVITVKRGGTVKTDNAEVFGNSARQGGFYGTSSSKAYGGIVETCNSKFYNNYAPSGAIFDMQCNSDIGYLMVDGCEFYNNASEKGLIYEYSYSRPITIKDSYFHDNECSVWACHAYPILDLSGKIVIEEDPDYTGHLYEAPIGIGGALAEGSVIPVSAASYNKLMADWGCLAKEVPTDNYYNPASKYTIQDADMAKIIWSDPGNSNTVLVKTDVHGVRYSAPIKGHHTCNGMLDVVPASAATVTNVNLFENFRVGTSKESKLEATQAVSDKVNNIPVAPWFHEGFEFAGWAKAETAAAEYIKKENAATYAENTNLYATWTLQVPELKLGLADADNPYCNTLKVTIENWGEDVDSYTYQWYKNDAAIEGAVTDTYTITEDASYKCTVTANAEGFNSLSASKTISAVYKEAPKVYVAQIVETGKEYETLAEAVVDANAMGTATIKLLMDIDLGQKLAITGKVTIIGEHTINRSAAYAGSFFDVAAGAALTLDGGLTIDGGNNWSFDKTTYEADRDSAAQIQKEEYRKEENGKIVYKYVTPAEDAASVTDHMILAGADSSVNLKKVSIQNEYGINAGAVRTTGTNAVVTLDGAHITHVASMEGNGVAVRCDSANTVIMNEGTVIDGNFVGGNHGLFKLYNGAKMTMNGGEITNTNGWDSNGVVVGIYAAGSEFTMNGGLICSNSSIWGKDNERNMAVNVHSGGKVTMTGGAICHNIGNTYGGGISSYKVNSTVIISAGMVVANKSLTNDIRYGAERGDDIDTPGTVILTGGIYGHDVSGWCAPGYVSIPYDQDMSAYCDLSYVTAGYDENTSDSDYIVTPGYRVSYYTIDGAENVTDPDSGQPETRYLTQYIHDEFLLVPKGKNHDEVDLFATPYRHINSGATQAIDEWYTDEAKTTAFDYSTEITSNIKLYGNDWVDIEYVCVNVETGVKYESIADAIAAVPENGTAVIKVLTDYTETDYNTDDESARAVSVENGKNITLDFAGHNVLFDSSAYTEQTDHTLFYTADGSGLTITGNGNIQYKGAPGNGSSDQPGVCLSWSAGTITFEDGTFAPADDDATWYSHLFFVEGDGTTYVKGGTYTGGEERMIDCEDSHTGKVILTGGTFNENIAETTQPNEHEIPSDYYLRDNGNGTWSVVLRDNNMDSGDDTDSEGDNGSGDNTGSDTNTGIGDGTGTDDDTNIGNDTNTDDNTDSDSDTAEEVIEEEAIPQGGLVVLFDEAVPLSAHGVPKTGDPSMIWFYIAVLSGACLLGMQIFKKRGGE